MLLAMMAQALICLPLLALLIPALAYASRASGFALLVAGPLYGLAVGTILRRVTARRWSRGAPEVLQVLTSART
jgi:hypothetical protein